MLQNIGYCPIGTQKELLLIYINITFIFIDHKLNRFSLRLAVLSIAGGLFSIASTLLLLLTESPRTMLGRSLIDVVQGMLERLARSCIQLFSPFVRKFLDFRI